MVEAVVIRPAPSLQSPLLPRLPPRLLPLAQQFLPRPHHLRVPLVQSISHLFLLLGSLPGSLHPTELQIVWVMVGRTFRKLLQAARASVLTYSSCSCPPALDTFVSALEGFVTGGLAFPSGKSQVSLTSSLCIDYWPRNFGCRPAHASSDLYCDAAKLRRRSWKRCWLSSCEYHVEGAANSAAV